MLNSLPPLKLVLTFASVLSLVHAESQPPAVDLGYASYQGFFDTADNVTTFNGIRYAAPPTGDLRWGAPQTPSTTGGVQPASTIPPACYQGVGGAALSAPTSISEYKRSVSSLTKRQSPTSESEDCLFLSISIPGTSGALGTDQKLPVVVWIHGGGYASGAESVFQPSSLVMEGQGGVIALSVQYRLGLFGFLAGKEMKEGGGVLNAGLLDQEFALKWVQKYIHLFGGDPDAVTIWGESAGAGSVVQHLVAHGGRTSPPLFRSAMTSSTYLPAQYKYDTAVPQALFNATAAGANCTSGEPSTVISCLRSVDAATLGSLNVAVPSQYFYGTYVFVPVIDGEFITQSPVKLLAEGKVNGKNLLSVTNTFEGLTFVSTNATAENNTEKYIRELWPTITSLQAKIGAALYGGVSSDATSRAIGIYGESIIICPTYWLLSAFAGRSWKGEFAVTPGEHAEDVLYYFPNLRAAEAIPVYNSSIFTQTFAQSFLSFAINENPNKKINASTLTPNWDMYVEGLTEMLFNTTNGLAADSEPVVKAIETDLGLLARCAFWEYVSGTA